MSASLERLEHALINAHTDAPSCFCLFSIAYSHKLYALLLCHNVDSVYHVARPRDYATVRIVHASHVCVCVYVYL